MRKARSPEFDPLFRCGRTCMCVFRSKIMWLVFLTVSRGVPYLFFIYIKKGYVQVIDLSKLQNKKEKKQLSEILTPRFKFYFPNTLGFDANQSKLLFEIKLPFTEVAIFTIENDSNPCFPYDPTRCYYQFSANQVTKSISSSNHHV